MMHMKTTTVDGSCRIKRQPKISMKAFLFILKQKVGSLVFGKDHKVIRPKKTFRLCLCNERWRIFAWIEVWSINSWPDFIENYGTIEKLSCIVNHAIAKYRERRFEIGLFYLVPDRQHLTFIVSSYLYGDGEFLKVLWTKKRLERSMKEKKPDAFLGCLPRPCLRVSESYVSEYRNISFIAVRTLRLCGM
ncbi:hypothetical protein VPH35_022207 [Triticum aestivum]